MTELEEHPDKRTPRARGGERGGGDRARCALRHQRESLKGCGLEGKGGVAGNTLATLPWIQATGDAIPRACWTQAHPVCVRCASSPSQRLGCWLLPGGLLHVPALQPPRPGGRATWMRPDSLCPLHVPGAAVRLSAPVPARARHPGDPQPPAPGRRRQPRGRPVGWQLAPAVAGPRGGEGGDQGLQQVTRLPLPPPPPPQGTDAASQHLRKQQGVARHGRP